MQRKTIPIEKIEQYHDAHDSEKIEWLVEDMNDGGWCGRPIVVIEMNGVYQALTGSHRYEAAKEAGLTEIPCAVAECKGIFEKYSVPSIFNDGYFAYHAMEEFDPEAAKILKEDLD